MAVFTPKWTADDGTEHDTEELAVRHELRVLVGKEADMFLATLGLLPPSRKYTEYKNVILKWEARNEQQEGDGVQQQPEQPDLEGDLQGEDQ